MQGDTQNAWTDLNDHIVDTYRSTRLDFSSTSNQNILKNLADSSQYSGCTSNGFADDSWIPSIESGAAISCRSSAGVDAGVTECPDNTAL